MLNNRMTEGVGRKIVDALKQQSETEIQGVVDNTSKTAENIEYSNEIEYTSDFGTEPEIIENRPEIPTVNYTTPMYVPKQSFKEKESFAADLDDFDMPANVAILKQLITQLPSGVSRQTGAQIIKQTMEALGISMKGVLQEAQQVQDNLNNTSRDCQASIVEHKKQIGILERQTQKLQRQSSALNDIISLFVQTSI